MDTHTVPAPGQRRSARIGGIRVDFRLDADRTGGALSAVEFVVDPGRLATPHLHPTVDEFLYVISGRIGVRVGEEVVQAGEGDYIAKPRNVAHAYWNPGGAPARVMMVMAPGGFERFFAELETLTPPDDPPAPADMAALAARYDLVIRPD